MDETLFHGLARRSAVLVEGDEDRHVPRRRLFHSLPAVRPLDRGPRVARAGGNRRPPEQSPRGGRANESRGARTNRVRSPNRSRAKVMRQGAGAELAPCPELVGCCSSGRGPSQSGDRVPSQRRRPRRRRDLRPRASTGTSPRPPAARSAGLGPGRRRQRSPGSR